MFGVTHSAVESGRVVGHILLPCNLTTTRTIFDPKTAVDSPVHELSEYLKKFHLKSLINVVDQVKCQIFINIVDPLAK